MTKFIRHIGVGHHPFSKKFEFKGYFDAPTPALIATDYKAPKTVLELWGSEPFDKGDGNLTMIKEQVTQIDEVMTNSDEFTYVSLFSGIGGFEQALNKLGGTCVLASEIDKFAEKAYQTLYGHATVGDISKVKAEDVPDHDVLVGGFPCQAFSVAGKRGGFEDARGTLFFEMARIAKEKQPKVLLAENVKGLVGHDKGRTLDTIVKTLNDIGYRVDFEVLNSKYFGVPQNRERIFIVAIREDLVENEPWIIEGNTVVPKGKRRISEYEGVKTFNFDWPEHGEVTTRLRDILEPEVDEKYYLDEEKTARLVAQLEEREERSTDDTSPEKVAGLWGTRQAGSMWDVDKIAPTLKTASGGYSEPLIDDSPQMLGHVDIKGHDAIKRVYSAEGVGPTLTTMGGGHREPKIAEVQSVGNVNPSGRGMNGQVYDMEAGLSPTLTTNKGEGVKMLEKDRSIPHYRIRKLTPLECWRLQGFLDEAHEAVKAAGISDSQRYKQAGNAVTVNVIEAVGERLLPYLDQDSLHTTLSS